MQHTTWRRPALRLPPLAAAPLAAAPRRALDMARQLAAATLCPMRQRMELPSLLPRFASRSRLQCLLLTHPDQKVLPGWRCTARRCHVLAMFLYYLLTLNLDIDFAGTCALAV